MVHRLNLVRNQVLGSYHLAEVFDALLGSTPEDLDGGVIQKFDIDLHLVAEDLLDDLAVVDLMISE